MPDAAVNEQVGDELPQQEILQNRHGGEFEQGPLVDLERDRVSGKPRRHVEQDEDSNV